MTIQEQILHLIKELNEKLGMSVLFITHDMGAVAQLCHSVKVMYLGQVVEFTGNEELFANPRHPYTKALLSAIPQIDEADRRQRVVLQGDVPSPIQPPSGCRFHTRCTRACERCKTEAPAFRQIAPGHFVACHFAQEAPQC